MKASLRSVPDTGKRPDCSWRAVLNEHKARVLESSSLASAYALLREKGVRDEALPDPDELEAEIKSILLAAGRPYVTFAEFMERNC